MNMPLQNYFIQQSFTHTADKVFWGKTVVQHCKNKPNMLENFRFDFRTRF